ncbi:MAG TPA: carbon-nitrogen hydrolase family protein [Pseudomonadales bacterium]|nr:carbon-nitrogen hydrolase family protein [Pseudomonadales bacterium]
MKPRIAVVQNSATADIDANKSQLAKLIADAATTGAQLIVLPEMCLCMDGAQYAALASAPHTLSWFAEQAKQHSIFLIAGAVPQLSPDGDSRLRSSLLVFNDQGQQIARYDKIHLFDVNIGDAQGRYAESERFAPGHSIEVIDSPFGKIGLSICFDLRFPEHFQALRDAGAELIIVPAAFTYTTGEAHWSVLLRARAIEQQCYVIAANQCGWHDAKRQTWGHSQIIDPWGKVLVELEHDIGVASADFDLDYLNEVRRRMPLRQLHQK